jgi:hypothetical protein
MHRFLVAKDISGNIQIVEKGQDLVDPTNYTQNVLAVFGHTLYLNNMVLVDKTSFECLVTSGLDREE